MRILVRTLTILVITGLMCVIVVRLNNINFLTNELHNASYLAIEETMNKEMDYLSSNKHLDFDIETSFKESFDNLVLDLNNYTYDIEGDKEHGILKINVASTYSKLVKPVFLTNIIEDNLETSKGGGKDEFDVDEFEMMTRSDNVLYEREFDEPVTLNSFYIDIEGYAKDSDSSPINRFEPEMKITIIDADGNEITYKKNYVKGRKVTEEKNFNSEDYDFEPIEVVYVKLEMKGIDRDLAPKADRLRIGSTGENYFEYDGDSSIIHHLYAKYINSSYKPADDSIWLKQDYQNILKEFLDA